MRGRLINDRLIDDRLIHARPINDARQHLIVALDVSSAVAARKIVAAVGDSASTYKVGMQLYTAEGPQIVSELVAPGRRIFLDLKYHDIPTTVASAVREAAKLGVSMLTVHASGGSKMLRAAVEAAASVNPELTILGVTVLTSMDENDLEESGAGGRILDQVLRLAELAIRSGCQGIVTSARETAQVRSCLGHKFAIATPRITAVGAQSGDQSRVVSHAEAIAANATNIVFGRPITKAATPADAVQIILQGMNVVG